MDLSASCFKCGKELSFGSNVGFKESCPGCDSDVHCCRNCKFYNLSAYNNCAEPQADRVVDKEKANFCDYFRPSGTKGVGGFGVDSVTKAKSSLDDLFKK